MPKVKKIEAMYPTMLVLSAACAAQRVNGMYVKVAYEIGNTEDTKGDPRKSNRQLVMEFIADPSTITKEDNDMASSLKAWYQGKTFKILGGGYMSEFDRNAMKLVEKEEIVGNYEIAVASSLPASYLKGVQRDLGENRAKFAQGGYLGKVLDRVTADIEVLKCVYSQKWGVYFVTAITDKDQSIFFSYKQDLTYGSKLSIKGTVKRQDNNQTQLNRVQVI